MKQIILASDSCRTITGSIVFLLALNIPLAGCSSGATGVEDGGSLDSFASADTGNRTDTVSPSDGSLADNVRFADVSDIGDAESARDISTAEDAGPGVTIREVILGADRNQLLIRGGMVVTADEGGDVEIIRRGEVFIDGDTIICVGRPGDSCDGTERATKIRLKPTDKVYPGLIDTHNHPHYNFAPLFEHSDVCYRHNTIWQGSREYSEWKDHYSRPNGDYPAANSQCEEYHYGFVASIFGGATAIQGVGRNSRCFRHTMSQPLLGRLLDSYDGIRADHVITWTMGIRSGLTTEAAIERACAAIDAGNIDRIYLHIAEGPRLVLDEDTGVLVENPAIIAEFNALYERAGGCLMQEGRAAALVFIHGNFTRERMETFAALGGTPQERPKFVWSPNSNTDLACWTEYATVYIPDILELGFLVSLAPDWRPSHGTGMITEVNLARRYAAEFFPEGAVTDEVLFKMMTVNAAKVTALDEYIGRIAPGMRADITVVAGETDNPFEPAGLGNIAGVVINGVLHYGDLWLMDAATMDAGECERSPDVAALTICGVSKRLCIPNTIDGDTVRFSDLTASGFVVRPDLATPDRLEPYTPESFDTLPGTCL